MTKSLLILGMGFSGEAIAASASSSVGSIIGTTRNEMKADTIRKLGFEAEIFDGKTISNELKDRLRITTHLVNSIAPGDKDPVLEVMSNSIVQYCPKLEWMGYLSTVGVYGNHDGAWVDEDTPPVPRSQRSIQRVKAEITWQEQADAIGVPLAVFRLSGIYGPGRNAFVNAAKGKSRRLIKPGQVFNRIHRDDIGTAVSLAMSSKQSGIYNITDDEPAPPQDVVTYAYEIMGQEPPPEIDFETAELSAMARSFYGENKRVSNAKSKQALGMKYIWPNYRVALERMWREQTWQ